ncbi:Hypothetical protein GLP15_2100 [Giardia lamblia P15]|uniref:Uncharacterized protein n=1 Tax=Giardia intestinalis (strain P15) TaxID=658858 RepID=E1F6C7_GIAIA|nr:Hypothetical protein GLP15_2100 [Giardia lamblia P15]
MTRIARHEPRDIDPQLLEALPRLLMDCTIGPDCDREGAPRVPLSWSCSTRSWMPAGPLADPWLRRMASGSGSSPARPIPSAHGSQCALVRWSVTQHETASWRITLCSASGSAGEVVCVHLRATEDALGADEPPDGSSWPGPRLAYGVLFATRRPARRPAACPVPHQGVRRRAAACGGPRPPLLFGAPRSSSASVRASIPRSRPAPREIHGVAWWIRLGQWHSWPLERRSWPGQPSVAGHWCVHRQPHSLLPSLSP